MLFGPLVRKYGFPNETVIKGSALGPKCLRRSPGCRIDKLQTGAFGQLTLVYDGLAGIMRPIRRVVDSALIDKKEDSCPL